MKEVENILRILKKTKSLIQSGDANEIKSLSGQTIHSATISQDADNIIVAVLVYSIGKVMERDYYKSMDGWKEFQNATSKNLDLAISSLEKGDVDSTRTYLGEIRNSLNKISTNLSGYIKDVFKKAEINKAFKLYEHGLSTAKTANLLGVSLWDLSTYIGQSSINDAKVAITMPEKNRIKIAEEIFS